MINFAFSLTYFSFLILSPEYGVWSWCQSRKCSAFQVVLVMLNFLNYTTFGLWTICNSTTHGGRKPYSKQLGIQWQYKRKQHNCIFLYSCMWIHFLQSQVAMKRLHIFGFPLCLKLWSASQAYIIILFPSPKPKYHVKWTPKGPQEAPRLSQTKWGILVPI